MAKRIFKDCNMIISLGNLFLKTVLSYKQQTLVPRGYVPLTCRWLNELFPFFLELNIKSRLWTRNNPHCFINL